MVESVVLQRDGKILVGGIFTALRGQSHTNVGRLNGDGTVDSTFTAAANGTVFSLSLQADGKILIGGGFTGLGGPNRIGIGRLNSDGTLDTGFKAVLAGGSRPWVSALALQ